MVYGLSVVESLGLIILFLVVSILIKFIANVFKIKKSTYISAIEHESFSDVYNKYFDGIQGMSRHDVRANKRYARKMKRKSKTKADKDAYYYKERVVIYSLAIIFGGVLSTIVYDIVDDKHSDKLALYNMSKAYTDSSVNEQWTFDKTDIPSLNNDEEYLNYIFSDGIQSSKNVLTSTKNANYGLYTIKLVDSTNESTIKIQDQIGRSTFNLNSNYNEIVNVYLNSEMKIEQMGADVELIPQDHRIKYDASEPEQGYYIFGKDYTNPYIDNEKLIEDGYEVEYNTIYNNQVYTLDDYKMTKGEYSELYARPGFSQVITKVGS